MTNRCGSLSLMTTSWCGGECARSSRPSRDGSSAPKRYRSAGGGQDDRVVTQRPDVDLALPELNGMEVTRQVRRVSPVAVLVVTMHNSDQLVQEAISAGASGYVLKADAGRTLVDAVRAILSPPVNSSPTRARRGRVRSRAAGPRPSESLTSREREVFQLLAEGQANKEIGSTARHQREDCGNAPRTNHGQTRSPLDYRAGAVRNSQPDHRTLTDRGEGPLADRRVGSFATGC